LIAFGSQIEASSRIPILDLNLQGMLFPFGTGTGRLIDFCTFFRSLIISTNNEAATNNNVKITLIF